MTRRPIYAALALLFAATALTFAAACSNGGEEHQSREGAGEHGGRQGQQHQQEGEESANQLSKSDTYDHTRAGARLILTYSEDDNTFSGTVENTTDDVLTRVRIEVHLSNGIELGPTTPGDLAPGQSRQIRLPASDEPFDTWSAHPEVGQEQANHQSDRQEGSG